MSYYCQINFKTIEGSEVFSFLQEFKKEITNKLPEIAEKNFIFSPYAKASEDEDVLTTFYKARDWAVDKVFKYRFFYLAEHKLLGVFGVPDAVKNLFDASIEFQNSCDQDYEYEHWTGVKIFEKIH